MNASPTQRTIATAAQVAALDAVLAHVPILDAEADKSLATSLRLHGQLCPILRRGGRIVDGRRRMRVLAATDQEPWVIDLPIDDGTSAQDPLLGRTFFELNACRRELTLGVRAAIADTLATLKKGANQHGGSAGMSREDAARAVGVSADTLDRYRRIKDVDDVHAKVLAGTLSLPQAVRTVECRSIAQKACAAVAPEGDITACIDQLTVDGVAYSLVLADPPWDYGMKVPGTCSSAPTRHYPTMPLNEIKALPVDRIAAKDAVLWLWTPNCLLAQALEVMTAWGFEYVTHAVWVKRSGSPTMGAVRPTHETLLMGRRGRGVITKGLAMKSAFVDDEPVTVHSRKPDHFAQELDRLYPEVAKVELFCRRARPRWTALGNQVVTTVKAGPAANDDEAPVHRSGVTPKAAAKKPKGAQKLVKKKGKAAEKPTKRSAK